MVTKTLLRRRTQTFSDHGEETKLMDSPRRIFRLLLIFIGKSLNFNVLYYYLAGFSSDAEVHCLPAERRRNRCGVQTCQHWVLNSRRPGECSSLDSRLLDC